MSPPLRGSLSARWVGAAAALETSASHRDSPEPLPEDAARTPLGIPSKRFDFLGHNAGKYADCKSSVAASVAYLENLSNQMAAAKASLLPNSGITVDERKDLNNMPHNANSVVTSEMYLVEPTELDISQPAESPLQWSRTISPLVDPWFQANFIVVDDEAPELETSEGYPEMEVEPDKEACQDMSYLDEVSTDVSASTPPMEMSMRFDDNSLTNMALGEPSPELSPQARLQSVSSAEALMKSDIAELRFQLEVCGAQTDCMVQELLSLRERHDWHQRINSKESLAQVQWLVERRELRRELAALPERVAQINVAARAPRTSVALQVASTSDLAQAATTRRKGLAAELIALQTTIDLRRSVGKELTATLSADVENRARDLAEYSQRVSQSAKKMEKLRAEEADLLAKLHQQTESQMNATIINADLGWQFSEAEVQIENLELRSSLENRSDTVSELRHRLQALEAARPVSAQKPPERLS